MSTSISVNMARATPADIDVGMELANFLEALSDGRMPFTVDEDQPRLDRNDLRQLQQLHDGLKALAERGSLFRVAWGLATIFDNGVIDPDSDMLKLHPRLESLAQQRDRAVRAVDHTQAWYAVRMERLSELAKEKGIWPEVSRILANGDLGGHTYPDGTLAHDPPTFSQLLAVAQHRYTMAEQRAAALPAATALLTQAVEAETALLDGEHADLAGAALQRVQERFQALLAAVPPPPAEHPDDLAVELFCARLKAHVARKSIHGPSGWQQSGLNALLSDQLRRNTRLGDPLEAAAVAMYLVARGELIAPAPPAAPSWTSPDVIPDRPREPGNNWSEGLWLLMPDADDGQPAIREGYYDHSGCSFVDSVSALQVMPAGWMWLDGQERPHG